MSLTITIFSNIFSHFLFKVCAAFVIIVVTIVDIKQLQCIARIVALLCFFWIIMTNQIGMHGTAIVIVCSAMMAFSTQTAKDNNYFNMTIYTKSTIYSKYTFYLQYIEENLYWACLTVPAVHYIHNVCHSFE